MRLSRIRITNFRNFREFDVPISGHAVIVGENKIGKSNLLFALRLVLDPSLPDTARQLRMEDLWDGLDRPLASDDRIEIAVEFVDFEDDEDLLSILAEHLVKPDPMTARLTYVFQPIATLEGTPKKDSDYEFYIFGGDRQENFIGGDVRRRIPMTLLSALRDAEGDLANWRRSPLRPLLETAKGLIDADVLEEVAEEVHKATEAVTDIKEVREVAARLSKKLTAMVGDSQALETTLGFSPTDPERLIRSLRLFIDGGDRAIADASLGSANLIYLALKSLELEELVAGHERDHAFLAIEEPEAHLHPHLQRLVYREFLRPRIEPKGERQANAKSETTTILLTTHSPHIASVAPLRSIVLLREKEGTDGTVGCSTSAIEFAKEDIADLERYLDVTRGEILFAKGIILVEGHAEVFVIPSLAKMLGHDLDKLGISVCSVSGTHFRAYVRLLGPKGLDIPFVVLTDFDPLSGGGNLGISRVLKLLAEVVSPETLEGKSEAEQLELAEKQGIFLNEHTFEVDLFKSGREKSICKTLIELAPGDTARERAEQWQDDPGSLDTKRFLQDISSIGKGRFAQRLCANMRNRKCPRYIREAMKHVVTRCE